MNTYHLKRYVLGRQPSLQISKAEYDEILVARRKVLEYLALEELFDQLICNYEEFERELLSIALQVATFAGALDDWSDSVDSVQLVGRRVANLLTTTKAYCDQLPHSISSLFGRKSHELQLVKEYLSEEARTVLGYRVCVELRNYMQHRGTVVHQLNRTMSWVTRPEDRRIRVYSVSPQVNVRRLSEDVRFAAAVLAELQVGGSLTMTRDRMHDLRPFVRAYVSALGRIHLKVRQLMVEPIVRHDSIIVRAVERFAEVAGADGVLGLSVMELNERELLEDRLPTFVMREPIERRRALERRNQLPTHFDTQVITNEIDS
jgi:hypothetical protein